MQINNSKILAIAVSLLDQMHEKLSFFESSLAKVEDFLSKALPKYQKSGVSAQKPDEFAQTLENFKEIARDFLGESQEISSKPNLRYEKAKTAGISKKNSKETANFKDLDATSLSKIKENFEISSLNRSNSNKLGLKVKSQKKEGFYEANEKKLPSKSKVKQGSMNESTKVEQIVIKNKTKPFSSSIDSNCLVKYEGSFAKDECDPRLLDIITLNEKKMAENSEKIGKNGKNCENGEINSFAVSDNVTENMIEIESVNNNKDFSINNVHNGVLSAREERNIVSETLRKEYKCDFEQISNYKSFKNEICFYIINSKWLRLWKEYVNFGNENGKSSKEFSANRPTYINNSEIIKSPLEPYKMKNFYDLRENLLEHYDFVALPKKIYKLFKAWYDIDFEIIRYLKPDPTQNNKMLLDIYPDKYLKTSLQNNCKKTRVLNNLILKNYKSSVATDKNSGYLGSECTSVTKSRSFSSRHHKNTQNCAIF